MFALLGTTYGGDGVTTFGLPDLRSRSVVGFGNGPGLSSIAQGEKSGTENVTIISTQMPAHVHGFMGSVSAHAFNGTASVADPTNAVLAVGTATPDRAAVPATLYAPAASANVTMAPSTITGNTGVAGGNVPLPIRNPYLGMYCIIAMEGIFPSRP
jgi:microcystin-dependent protein